MITTKRLLCRLRARLRLLAARAAIHRAERSVRRRTSLGPGYDELSDPLFLGTMALAIAVICFDVGGEFGPSILVEWVEGIASLWRSA